MLIYFRGSMTYLSRTVSNGKVSWIHTFVLILTSLVDTSQVSQLEEAFLLHKKLYLKSISGFIRIITLRVTV